MTDLTPEQALRIVNNATQLAQQENDGIWKAAHATRDSLKTDQERENWHNFVVKTLDSVIPAMDLNAVPNDPNGRPDVSTLHLKDNETVNTFLNNTNNPTIEQGMNSYAAGYVNVARTTAALDAATGKADLSGAIIANVDKRYEKGGPGAKGFNAEEIATGILREQSPKTLALAQAAIIARMEGSRKNGSVSSEEATNALHEMRSAITALKKNPNDQEAIARLARFDFNGDGEFNARDLEKLNNAKILAGALDRKNFSLLTTGIAGQSFPATHVDGSAPLPRPVAGGKNGGQNGQAM